MPTDKTMKFFELFDDLSIIMNNIKVNKNISVIEKDIALEKLREMYILISKINPEGTDQPLVENVKITEVKKTEKKQEKQITEEPEKNYKDKSEDFLTKNTEQEEITQTPNEAPENEVAVGTLGDKYQGSKQSMNEHISKQHHSQDISNKIQSRPIDDIGKAIGLNEKFLFINELFKGDSSSFKKTIEKLNNASDFNEAFTFLNNHFSWNMKDETTQKFLELLRRKFISTEK